MSSIRTIRCLITRAVPLAVVALGASAFVAQPAMAAQGPVGLGTASSFAVLAGSGITNTGPTTVTGDMGTFPTPTETGFGSITLTGTNHAGDAVTQGAKNDLTTGYNDAAGRNPATNVPVELGGTTLLAGVYTSPTFGLTGTLTLDGKGNPDAEFVFQAGSTLITASNSHVVLENGANPCHVVWQIGSSATFGTSTQFVGDVLAHTSITAQTAATFEGRLLAGTGAVTLDTNTITSASCAGASGGGTTTTAPASTTTTAPTTTTTATTSTTTAGGHATTATPGAPAGGTGGAGGNGAPAGGSSTATPLNGTSGNGQALPRTGAGTAALVVAALALLAAGTLVTAAARRKPTNR